MASSASIIGKATRVRGRVTGDADLEVQGWVDGEIAVGGDVTVETSGMVGAGIRGRRLVVRGAVKGDLVGDEAILLEEGARVVGDVRAPRVVIGPGALVRGFVDTGEGGGAARSQQRAAPAARPALSTPRPTAAAPVAAKPAAAPAPAHAPAVKAADKDKPAAHAGHGAHVTHSGNNVPVAPGSAGRRPPPPVVPALKKAKGQMAKKKER
jgi:cytoskeletal protein CcmA (bactofilin family)